MPAHRVCNFILGLGLLLLSTTPLFAQNCSGGCTDPINCPAQPSYSCPADFLPVCGCNGTTYRNACIARYQNGILTTTDGPCSGYAMEVFPQYGIDELNINIFQYENSYGVLTVYDAMGNVRTVSLIEITGYNTIYTPFNYKLTDIATLEPGIYILVFENGVTRFTSKFLKYNQN